MKRCTKHSTKVMSIVLGLVMIFGSVGSAYATNESIPKANALQNEEKNNDACENAKEVYTDYTLGGTIERNIINGIVKVTFTSFDGQEKHEAINTGSNLILDGELIDLETNDLQILDANMAINSSALLQSSTVKWAKDWQYFNEKIKTGGMLTGAICVAIVAVAPWLALEIGGGLAGLIAARYSYVVLKGKIKYGNDGTYLYYKRYSNLYGNGKEALFKKDFYDTGKSPLK